MHLPKELIEKKNELLLSLRREMNGAVAGAMRDGGIVDYSLNFGVSVPTIRSVAKSFAGDDALAQEVWGSGVRELRLASLFIASPSLLATEKWCSEVDTLELAENYVWSLSRSDEALDRVVERLMDSRALIDRYMVLLSFARRMPMGDMLIARRLCQEAEQSGEPALQRVAENLRITMDFYFEK